FRYKTSPRVTQGSAGLPSNEYQTTPFKAVSRRLRRIGLSVAAIAVVFGAAFLGIHWCRYRLAHSITDDAFVEAHCRMSFIAGPVILWTVPTLRAPSYCCRRKALGRTRREARDDVQGLSE